MKEYPTLMDNSLSTAATALMEHAIYHAFAGRIALVSSFGAESAVLLAMAAAIAPNLPVLFLQTDRHFPETLEYRQMLSSHLGLLDVRDVSPDDDEVGRIDPTGGLAGFDPDACCDVRKVAPLARALEPFDAWITGRKRFQSSTRTTLPLFELTDGRVKLNPLAGWNAEDIQREHQRRRLPAHPLMGQGYSSIGCAPCTMPVALGQTARSGRWPGLSKTECGIHRQTAAAPSI